MLFELDVLRNGQPRKIYFDNFQNKFIEPATGKILLGEYRTKDYARWTPNYDIDFSDICILFINMGLKCNFSCKYCHQNHFRESTQVTNCTPSKVPHLLEILHNRKDLNPRSIAIWGGEPLVYWKSLKLLLPGLRELYPKAKINFPTNGSLLNKEILDLFKKYDINFYISYDGKTTNRDVSIFDRKELVDDLKEWGKSISIMPTQNRASIPIKAIRDEFDKMGLRLNSIAPYSIARCNPFNRDQAEEIYIPEDKCKAHSQFLYDVLHDHVESPKLYHGLIYRFEHIVQTFIRGMGIDARELTFCGNCHGKDVCIDCEGKIFNCMNIPIHVMGSLENFKPFDASKIFVPHFHKKTCLECPYVGCCRGGCPLIHDDQSLEFRVNCHNLKIIAVPFFRTVIETLLGVYLKKITRLSDGKVFGEW